MHKCDMVQICPDCQNEEATTLWITYYNQYYNLCKMAVRRLSIDSDTIIPTLLLMSQYIEIWIKTIACNYGIGKGKTIAVGELTGHNIIKMFEELIDILSEDEYFGNKRILDRIYNWIWYFNELCATDEISLSEATRYPLTRKGEATLNPCLVRFIQGECSLFEISLIKRKANALLKLTYSIYNALYDERIGIKGSKD